MAAMGDLLGDLLGVDTLTHTGAAAEQASVQHSRDAASSLLDDMELEALGTATCSAAVPSKCLEQQQQQTALKQAACSPAHLLQLSQQLSAIGAQGSSQRLHSLLVLVLEQYEATQQQLPSGRDVLEARQGPTTTSSSSEDTTAAQLQQQLAAALQEVAALRAARQEAADRQHQVQQEVHHLREQLEDAAAVQAGLAAEVSDLQERLLVQEGELTHLRLTSLATSKRPSTPGQPLGRAPGTTTTAAGATAAGAVTPEAASRSSGAPGTPTAAAGVQEVRTPFTPADSQVAHLRGLLDQTQQLLQEEQERSMGQEREVRDLQQQLAQQAAALQTLTAQMAAAGGGAGSAGVAASSSEEPQEGVAAASKQVVGDEQKQQEVVEELLQQLAAAEAATEAATAAYAAAKTAQDRSEEQQRAEQERTQQLMSEMEDVRRELQAAEGQHREVAQQLQQAVACKDTTQAELAAAQQQLGSLQQQVDRLQQELEARQQQQQQQPLQQEEQQQRPGRVSSGGSSSWGHGMDSGSASLEPPTPDQERHSSGGGSSPTQAPTAAQQGAAGRHSKGGQVAASPVGEAGEGGVLLLKEQARGAALQQELADTQARLGQLLQLIQQAALAQAAAAQAAAEEGRGVAAVDLGPLLLLAEALQGRYCSPEAQQRLRLAGQAMGQLLQGALAAVRRLKQEAAPDGCGGGPPRISQGGSSAAEAGSGARGTRDTSPQADVWCSTTAAVALPPPPPFPTLAPASTGTAAFGDGLLAAGSRGDHSGGGGGAGGGDWGGSGEWGVPQDVPNGLHQHSRGPSEGGGQQEAAGPPPEATTLDGAWWNQGPQQSLTVDDLPDFLRPK